MSETKVAVMSYWVQAFHADGKPGVAAAFGSPETAQSEADRFVSECGYARSKVEVWEGCTDCGGHGRKSKRKGKKIVAFAYIECKTCKGEGMWVQGSN